MDESKLLRDKLRQAEKESSRRVFKDTDEDTPHKKPGFENLSDFQSEIRRCNQEIETIDIVLEKEQEEILNLQIEYDFYEKNPDFDITGSAKRIKTEIGKIKEHAKELQERKKELQESRAKLKEAIIKYGINVKNRNKTVLDEKKKLNDEYEREKNEAKGLKDKVLLGTANNLEKFRLDELEKSNIPDIENMLGISKEEPVTSEPDDDDDEIVAESDGTSYTLNGGFRKHWKKIVAAAAILGGIALTGYLIYQAIKQGQADTAHDLANSITNGIGLVKEQVDGAAQAAMDSLKHQQIEPTGNVFRTAHDLATGQHPLTPNEWFRYDNIMGAFDSHGKMYDVTTVDQIQDLVDKGIDIVGARTGDPNISDPTLKYSGYVPLDDILARNGGVFR